MSGHAKVHTLSRSVAGALGPSIFPDPSPARPQAPAISAGWPCPHLHRPQSDLSRRPAWHSRVQKEDAPGALVDTWGQAPSPQLLLCPSASHPAAARCDFQKRPGRAPAQPHNPQDSLALRAAPAPGAECPALPPAHHRLRPPPVGTECRGQDCAGLVWRPAPGLRPGLAGQPGLTTLIQLSAPGVTGRLRSGGP